MTASWCERACLALASALLLSNATEALNTPGSSLPLECETV